MTLFISTYSQITGNQIGAEGGKAIGEALKSNTSLTELNLTVAQQQQQHFSFSHSQITGNQIGDEGGKAICEALKTNTSLTELNLTMTHQQQHFSLYIHKSQTMELELKEGKPLVRH